MREPGSSPVRGPIAVQRAAGAVLCAALSALVVPSAADSARAASSADQPVSRTLLERTNALRVSSGWVPLSTDARLTEAAERFSVFMAATDRYGHEADGHTPAERAKAHGYAFCAIGENIAVVAGADGGDGAPDLAQRVFDNWSASLPHRRNMLDGDMSEVGIASARSIKTGRVYAVQLVGRPSTAAVVVSLVNRTRATVRYDFAGETFSLEPGVTRTHSRCRKALLALKDPDLDARAAKPITTTPGARYRIEDGTGGAMRLRRE
jgi:uncharacterized protein YkwD